VKTPSVNFEVAVQGNNLILSHKGGDPLRTFKNGDDFNNNGEYYILVNNDDHWPVLDDVMDPVLKNSSYEEGHKFEFENNAKDSDYFNNGETLVAKFDDSLPENIKVVSKQPSGSEQIIWSASISEGVNFYATDTRACLNQPVPFYDGSNNHPKTWLWDFGDGSSSTEQNPIHIYTHIGYYTVSLNTTVGDTSLPYSVRKDNYIDVRNIHAAFSGSPRVGEEPLRVDFKDESLCNPTGWSWNLGDGALSLSTIQNPYYTYITNGDGKPKKIPISLTVKNGSYSDTLTIPDYITVNPKCFTPIANFQYTGRRDIDNTLELEFTDLSTSTPESIVSWFWDFGDGSSSTEQNPRHDYSGTNYTITLTVGNDCGRYNSTNRKIVFPCTELTPLIQVAPLTGPSPLSVSMSDNSSPTSAISAWWWSFGDGTTYSSTNVTTRNPPNHTYDRVGTYYVSLMIQNECGQAFYKTPIIVVSQAASIGGKIWNDQNSDQVLSNNEAVTPNWKVTLQNRVGGVWQNVSSTYTNSTGNYYFDLQGVSYGVYRVVEDIPANWQPTYSYGTNAQVISDNLLIYNQRDYRNVDFGNVQNHISSISIPGKFTTFGRGSGGSDGTFYYSSLSRAAQYLDYNTTYNTTPRTVMMNPADNSGIFTLDAPGGFPNGFSKWGDSSFTLTFREYNNYLKYEGYGAYFLDWSKYNGVNYTYGINFPIPDNTSMSASNFDIRYKWDPSIHFVIDKPKEGSTIPYTSDYTIEAHFEGLGEQTSQCDLLTPTIKDFSYNTTVAEYLVTHIDTRPYEGQNRLFTARMTLSSGKGYNYTFSNATIGWEPITVVISKITSEVTSPNVRGNATINANITGKWQNNLSATLALNDNERFLMTKIGSYGVNTTVQCMLNVEPYAGQNIPISVRVPYQSGKGTYVDSPTMNITILSKLPIQANYSADPYSGPSPLEVAFTDLSTGGASKWNWNFSDGNTSSIQNPVHTFQNRGNYSVSLTVTNASNSSSSISRNISSNQTWSDVNLMTSRACTLFSGGVFKWIVRGGNSSITVNGTQIRFQDGDKVQLSLNKDHNIGRFFIAGEISDCNLTNVTLQVNGTLIQKGNVSAIRINDFENFHSNITLSADMSYYAWITFQWNGTVVPVSWKRKVIISDLMPTSQRYMNLDLQDTKSYFDGRASNYRFV
jgi:PKD repeat protein